MSRSPAKKARHSPRGGHARTARKASVAIRVVPGFLEIVLATRNQGKVREFVELMRQLGRAIDTEAATLAAQPVPGERDLAPA